MENHPIPQDVTGFQFKLIGNMTVKQFAYLATGVVFAWILWQLPVATIVKLPFCAIFALSGVGLAFLPISGRPMDLMIGNYLKALFRPTQFIYVKTGGQIYFPGNIPTATAGNIKQYKNEFSPLPKDKLKDYLESLNIQPANKVDEKENRLLDIPQLNPITYTRSDSPKPLNDLSPVKVTPPVSTQATPPLAPTNVAKADMPPLNPVSQRQAAAAMPTPKGYNKNIGMPSVPEFPNLITGITKDARGNALSNILVEVKDQDGNPVRAFKTNELGRFASATPLINSAYTIEFEDPKGQNKFEKISINVAGQIILPIEAVSIDAREELRKSLFAN